MADVFDNIQSAMQAFRERLSVTTVYGEPVSASGLTVIPVSRVRFGFGGGGGAGQGVDTRGGDGDQAWEGEGTAPGKTSTGGGSGGGIGFGGGVEPLGYIEISDAGSRWVPIEPPRGEVFLRVLAIAPAMMPTGRGRGGLLRRLLLLIAGQAIVGSAIRQRLAGGSIRGLLPKRAAQEPA